MIKDWREKWNKDFSFYFVQIAPFSYGNELSPALRDAQRKSLKPQKNWNGHNNGYWPFQKAFILATSKMLEIVWLRLALAKRLWKKILLHPVRLYNHILISGNTISVEFDFSRRRT